MILRIRALALVGLLGAVSTTACASGNRWANEPFRSKGKDEGVRIMETPEEEKQRLGTKRTSINAPEREIEEHEFADVKGKRPQLKLTGSKRRDVNKPLDGRLLGVFRNTYYDFPSEYNYSGPPVDVMNRSCRSIQKVPRGFYEALCVQGSGTLASGVTVSFAKRDCSCAAVCPRTGQKICFDALDQQEFPWGRGALGKAITPLLTIAVDSNVIPLGTRVYIPEYDGVARRPGGAPHDGCFVAEDRGMKVVEKHVDIFTGNPSITEHMNSQVPSNQGVHVYTGTARCSQ